MPSYPFFVGPAYQSQSRIASADRLVNWYPQKVEAAGAQVPWALYPAPGFSLVTTLATRPGRASLHQNGRTFVIAGSSLYELSPSYADTVIGTGLNNPDDRPAGIVSNGAGGNELFMRSGTKGYIYDLVAPAGVTFVIDGADQIGFLDGFFLALDVTAGLLKISDLFDGATWDPSQVTQRNSAPDRWAGMIVAQKQIWLFGSETTDIYYNAGTSPFPFLPNPSVFLDVGIAAPESVAVLNHAPIWLGRDRQGTGIVYTANGYTPTRVSDHALEYAIGQYATIADAEGWAYQDQGHSFYVLTFPTAEATWVYDATVGAWHQRGSAVGSTFRHLPVRGHALSFDGHLVLGMHSGRIYRMAIDLASDVYEVA